MSELTTERCDLCGGREKCLRYTVGDRVLVRCAGCGVEHDELEETPRAVRYGNNPYPIKVRTVDDKGRPAIHYSYDGLDECGAPLPGGYDD